MAGSLWRKRVPIPRLAAAIVVGGAAAAGIVFFNGVNAQDQLRPGPTAATASRSPVEALAAYLEQNRVVSGQQFFGDANYVGSPVCKGCHLAQYEDWSTTWHAKMERLPSPETVVGDFNDRLIVYRDVQAKTKDGKSEKITFSVRTSTSEGHYFFTVIDSDNAANNQTYEIAKVLGGKWDQHYEVKIGENFLPAPIRWSVFARDWLISSYRPEDWVMADGTPDGRPLRPDELPRARFAEAKCSGCHTTGFEFYKDPAANHWKARGTGELGISCERCHGPGSRHVSEANAAKARGESVKAGATTIVHPLKDLTALQQTELCGQCHGRNTNKTSIDLAFPQDFRPGDVDMTTRVRFWNYSATANPNENKYFYPNDWAKRNRQQWQDFTKSKHFNKAGMSCVTCHTFHGKWEEAQLRQPSTELCVGCHTANGYANRPNAEMFDESPMQKAGVRCVDCHMPKIGYRSDKTATTPHPWDVTSHTFMVAPPRMEIVQGIRSSCAGCHEGNGRTIASGAQAPPMAAADLDFLITQQQAETRKGIEEVQIMLRSIRTAQPEATRLASEARAKLAMILLDGSMGFHNYARAIELITEAHELATQARALN
jgi:predicted CXXCH cytochrome family protein